MTQRARANYVTGTPTELILVSGKTDAGRDIEVAIPSGMAKEILTIAAAAYEYCGHVGHAMWHMKNPEYAWGDTCDSCRRSRDDK